MTGDTSRHADSWLISFGTTSSPVASQLCTQEAFKFFYLWLSSQIGCEVVTVLKKMAPNPLFCSAHSELVLSIFASIGLTRENLTHDTK